MDIETLSIARKHTSDYVASVLSELSNTSGTKVTKKDTGQFFQYSQFSTSVEAIELETENSVYYGTQNLLKWTAIGTTTNTIINNQMTYKGVTISFDENGKITLDGTATATFYIYGNLTQQIRSCLIGHTLKISFYKSGSESLIFNSGVAFDGGTYGHNLTSTSTKAGIMTNDYMADNVRIIVNSGTTYSNMMAYAMFEIGDSATYVTSYVKGDLLTSNTNTKIVLPDSDIITIFSDSSFVLKYEIKKDISEYIDDKILELKKTDALYDKSVVFIGDSLCYGQEYSGGYSTVLKEINPNTTFLNYSQGGSQISSNHANSGNYWISNQLSKISGTPDFIIAEGYINDYCTSCPLGAITVNYTSTFDTTTFYGGMEDLCKKMVTNYTSAKVGFIITHSHYTSSNTTTPNIDYLNAIKECCQKWNVPYLDLSNVISPLVPIFSTTYYSDKLHYNELGYRKISPAINEWMKIV